MSTRDRAHTIAVLLGIAVGLLAAPLSAAAQAPRGEPIVVGSVWPFTGTSAALARDGRRGMEIAQEIINRTGGLGGRPLEIVFEDDRGDARAGVAAIEKLVVQNKAVALVGGIGSGPTQAYFGALQKYAEPPLFISTGASARSIEERFGHLDWAFFVHPWEYHYQESLHAFLLTLDPKPKTIAIAHEDGVYGTSHAEMAADLYRQSGIDVVMRESFKTGTADVSGIITRAKFLNPDVFYWIGYGKDQVLFTRQTKELNFSPKLFITTVQAGAKEYYDSVGKDGEFVTFIAGWVPGVNYPASQTFPQLFPSTEAFLARFKEKFGTDEPHYYAPMAFSALMSLAAAVRNAGTLERGKVIEALGALETMTPMGPLKVGPSRKAKHHYYNTMMVMQWQKGRRVLVYPKAPSAGIARYPMPPWASR